MNTILTVLIVVLVIAVAGLALLYYFGQKAQVRQYEAQKTMQAMSQTVSMLVIDKKKMKLKEAPLPPEVYEKTPLYLKRMKVFVVKAKIGPKIYNLICEKPVYNLIPVKATIQAKISGLYITEILKGAVPNEEELKRRHKVKEKAAKKAAREAKKKK